MSKHTEGPWEIYTWAEHMKYAGLPASIGESDDLGMEADDVCNMVQLEDEQETWANARLIAAAPELLEALSVMIMACDECNGQGVIGGSRDPITEEVVDMPCPMCIHARAAIKKARGEQ